MENTHENCPNAFGDVMFLAIMFLSILSIIPVGLFLAPDIIGMMIYWFSVGVVQIPIVASLMNRGVL